MILFPPLQSPAIAAFKKRGKALTIGSLQLLQGGGGNSLIFNKL